MSNADQPGNRYWSLVEPVWIPLNERWNDEPQVFLTRFRQAPAAAGHLYAAHWCQSEVCNGGLHQFFYNSTGLLAPEALGGFQVIGLHEWSLVLAEAMAFFGPRYPRERNARLGHLPDSNGRRREEWDPFCALDERFYNWLHAEENRWERAADMYAELA